MDYGAPRPESPDAEKRDRSLWGLGRRGRGSPGQGAGARLSPSQGSNKHPHEAAPSCLGTSEPEFGRQNGRQREREWMEEAARARLLAPPL